MPEPTFRRFRPGDDDDALVDLLTSETWPFRVKARMTEEDARSELDRGHYAGAEVLTFLIEVDGAVVGLVRAEDLSREGEDPQLDFRVCERWRSKGIGRAAIRHITHAMFEALPEVRRIEGQTRKDNIAMRRTFLGAGFVQEAVYREAWPAGDGWMDGVGYAILRRDWETGESTPPDWTMPEADQGPGP